MHSQLRCGRQRNGNLTNILVLNIFKYDDLTEFIQVMQSSFKSCSEVIKQLLLWQRIVYFKISEYLHSFVVIFNNRFWVKCHDNVLEEA